MCVCSFGISPSPLCVLPVNGVLGCNMPMATIMDFAPMVNIMSFGTCSSLAYPATASATAAAFGVLTPMPCVPVITTPWVSASPTITIGVGSAINMGDKAMCKWGGVINITVPGQFTVL